MKGLFIPDITTEMFRNGCLEGIEALMAEGEIYDIDYEPEPQIVLCKDCKHQEKFFHEDKRRKEGGYYIFGCELADGYSHVCLDEDFCSQAERKDT